MAAVIGTECNEPDEGRGTYLAAAVERAARGAGQRTSRTSATS